MPDRMVLPGTIPGLLRRGSPVAWRIDGETIEAAGVVLRVLSNGRSCAVAAHMDDSLLERDKLPLPHLDLDLTDATGRAHAAQWLALREVPQSHHLDPAAVSWSPAPAQASCGWAIHWLARAPGSRTLTGSWWTGVHSSPVPRDLLADLDRDDARCLPDGSRVVDAEALRRVVLHAAGVVEVLARGDA